MAFPEGDGEDQNFNGQKPLKNIQRTDGKN